MIDNCPTIQSLKNEFEINHDLRKNFPIINNYLNQKNNIKNLSNLIKMNPFANYMLNHYSYDLIRPDGEKLTIKEELQKIKINNKLIVDLYKDFETGWNAISSIGKHYKCHQLEKKTLSETDSIAYCLNDNGYFGFGMHLAAYYFNFIQWQNDFLDDIINNDSPICCVFKESINKKVMVQDATANEVVSFKIDNANSIFNSIEELFNCCSFKDCFNEDWSINYLNYSTVHYNFALFEEELSKILLPGKRSFNTKQRFISYGYEGCRDGGSSIITDYLQKYPQDELNDEQKKVLDKFSNQSNRPLNKVMFSLNMLISYIQKNNNYKSNDSIAHIINNLPKYINPQYVRRLFVNDEHFKVNQLIRIFEYFEKGCFRKILDNILTTSQEKIPDDLKKTITDFFEDRQQEQNQLIQKKELATATRRFISRKLSGQRTDNEFRYDVSLLFFIKNSEYWPKVIADTQEFEKEFEILQNKFLIEVKHAKDFYFLLGGDGAILIQNISNSNIQRGFNYD